MKNIDKIKIGSQILDVSKDVFIISEIGINHEGNINLCAEMIKKSAKAGANAIKLQTIDADENYSKHSISYSIFKKAWLTPEETSNMFDYAKSLGVQPFTTVGDFKTLQWIRKLKPKLYKISSGLITHLPLIKKISSIGETLIISSGTANQKDLDDAIGACNKKYAKNIILLHCVSSYPTPFNQANLSTILSLRKKYKLAIGYSDHVLGYNASLAAVTLGSSVIEKHFTLNTSRKDFDHKISLNPKEFGKMVNDIKIYKSMYGEKESWVSEIEKKNKTWMRRIIVSRSDFSIGHKIKANDIMYMRPASGTVGLSPIEAKLIIGKEINKKIYKFEPIKLHDLNDK